MLVGEQVQGGEKLRGGEKWDNCNSIINKIHVKKELIKICEFLCSHLNIEDGRK